MVTGAFKQGPYSYEYKNNYYSKNMNVTAVLQFACANKSYMTL